jgi:hypothetical protein
MSKCFFKGKSQLFWKLIFLHIIKKNVILYILIKKILKKLIFGHFEKQIWISRQIFL